MNKCLNVILSSLFVLLFSNKIMAQDHSKFYRIAKITVDSTQLQPYKKALLEQMNAALSVEKGVLSYTAVYDKEHTNQITIFETYASKEAYNKHTQAPHFLKYKNTVANMVKHLELEEVIPLAIQVNKMK